MPGNKRFRIGNMTVNLGKLDDVKYQPNPNCVRTYITGCPAYTLGCFQFTGGGRGCFPFTVTGGGCNQRTIGGCGINYSTLPPTTILDGWPQEAFIPDLKASLINQLKEIEAYELELEIQETPQTIEEMDALENELENSLKALKELKNNFKG